MISIDTDDHASEALEGLPEALDGPLQQAVYSAINKAERRAETNHEFTSRTGTLQSAIMSELRDDFAASLFIDSTIAPHGKYIHDGTEHISPDPFIDRAISESEIVNEIEDAVDEALQRTGLI